MYILQYEGVPSFLTESDNCHIDHPTICFYFIFRREKHYHFNRIIKYFHLIIPTEHCIAFGIIFNQKQKTVER